MSGSISETAEALRAQALLERCIAGEPIEVPRELIDSAALFSVLAEGLSDRFEPRLADCYARIFSELIAAAAPEFRAADLLARYERVRRARPVDARAVERVYVLSRVTLGADVAITGVLLDGAMRRFPHARIIFAGSAKNWQLFAGRPRIEHLPFSYKRDGGLRERVEAVLGLREPLSRPGSIVIDPDSRLTQLGLLPVCPEENYYFFESRAYGAESSCSLTDLARRWASEIIRIADAGPFVAPVDRERSRERVQGDPRRPGDLPHIAVSLGVGENAAKRIADPFETELLRHLAARGAPVIVDSGGGGEESERVARAVDACGDPASVTVWRGSFAEFASIIAASRLYVGYDSAGQHVAAACGVPLVTVFAGFPCERMFQRWQPAGPGPKHIVRVDDPRPERVLDRTKKALSTLGF